MPPLSASHWKRCALLSAGVVLAAAAGRGDEGETGPLGRYLRDPTLGGKLHIAYRAVYEAKFFRYGSYRFNFPGDVSPDDQAAADELRRRHRDRAGDHDLDQHLSIRTHDLFLPEEPGPLDGVDTELAVRWWNDIDGSPTGDEAASTFDDLDGRENLQFRALNARIQLLEKRLEVAGGRMYVEGAEWATLDGARATGRGLAFLGRPFEIEAFAGARVSFYSTVPRTTVWGGALRIWPWKSAELELATFYFLANTFQATFEQRLGDAIAATAVYRQIDEDPESVRIGLDAKWAERGWTAWFEYFGKLGLTAKDYFFDTTALVDASSRERRVFRFLNLGDLDPYDEWTLEARKELAGRLGLFAGGTVHLPRGESHRDQFNTEWYEVWTGVDTTSLPWGGLSSRTTLRYVYTDLPRRRPLAVDPFLTIREDVESEGEPSFLGLEFLIEQDLARRVTLGATVEFRQYDYETRFAGLSDLIGLGATAYIRYRQNRFLSYALTYAYERDYRFVNPDLEDVHGLRVEAALGF